MTKGYCFLSAVPVRAEASDKAEMVNQMLMGEAVKVIRRDEKWSYVQNAYDGYEGWIDNKQYVAFESAATLAERYFLGTPYLWGGRSIGGIDCSGLVQICFKAMGVWVPRDASMQALLGTEVDVAEAAEDDLAFFSNSNGRIVHVGIFMGGGRIIHSSGYVRIDRLDSKGIFDEKIGQYTHSLAFVKRSFSKR